MGNKNAHSQRGCIRTILLFVLGASAILLGGLGLSKWIDTKSRKKVDKNGVVLKAVVSNRISNSKGRSTFYRFYYKNREYNSSESGRALYEKYSLGDTITILVDTSDPKNTYVIY